jgi:hypothetical protein
MNRTLRTRNRFLPGSLISLAVFVIGGVAEVGAQVTSKVVTATRNSVEAKGSSTKTVSIASSTDVTAGKSINASNQIRCNFAYRNSYGSLTIAGGGGRNCSVQSKVVVSAGGFCSSGLAASSAVLGDVLFELTSASGVVDGALVISASLTQRSGVDWPSKVTVDVHNDGKVEFMQDLLVKPALSPGRDAYTISIPLSLGPTPTVVRLKSDLGGSSYFGADHTLDIDAEFVPAGGIVTNRGPACRSGVDLDAWHVAHQPSSSSAVQKVYLRPKPLPVSTIACVYAFGGQEWGIPLAPTNCLLRNNATVLMFMPVSAPSLTVEFPVGTTPITFYGQFAFATKAAGGFDLLHTSNSFLAVLK